MLLKQYIEKIQALPGQESFCMTEEFKEVFGDAKGLETMASVSHANIDMVCQNVMMDENRWTMIDYEWAIFSSRFRQHFLYIVCCITIWKRMESAAS